MYDCLEIVYWIATVRVLHQYCNDLNYKKFSPHPSILIGVGEFDVRYNILTT